MTVCVKDPRFFSMSALLSNKALDQHGCGVSLCACTRQSISWSLVKRNHFELELTAQAEATQQLRLAVFFFLIISAYLLYIRELSWWPCLFISSWDNISSIALLEIIWRNPQTFNSETQFVFPAQEQQNEHVLISNFSLWIILNQMVLLNINY